MTVHVFLFHGPKYNPQHSGNEWQQDEKYPQMLHDPAGNVSGVCERPESTKPFA
jgi:hypothetical protein